MICIQSTDPTYMLLRQASPGTPHACMHTSAIAVAHRFTSLPILHQATSPAHFDCRYVLRNWMLQQAIEQAECGDYSEVQRLLNLITDPYAAAGEQKGCAAGSQQAPGAAGVEGGIGSLHESASTCVLRRYDGPVPQKYSGLCVTCSS